MLVGFIWWGILSATALPAPAPYSFDPPDLTNPKFFCLGDISQSNLDLSQVLGKWYAVEIVHHRDDGTTPHGRTVVNSCPILHLTRYEGNMIRLHWEEKAGQLVYNFRVDEKKPGFWVSSGPQNGSLLYMTRTYKQFAGTVEVAKAVGTHMVLTFCAPGSELYSVVMSRNSRLPQAELRGVNKMLEFRGLHKYVVREACRDSAASTSVSLLALITSLSFLIKSNSFLWDV